MFKIFATLLRGASHEAEEALFDANAIRLLEQNLRDANRAFELAKHELARVMAEDMAQKRHAAELGERITRLEAEARTAIARGDLPEAERLAGRIAVLTDEQMAHQETGKLCAREATRIRDTIDQAARRLAELKRGLTTARAVDAMQRTRGRLGDTGPAGMAAIREAEATLQRLRERQHMTNDVESALETVERDLPVAGGTRHDQPRARRTDPAAVLARLRQKEG
jgi:phage shock protein A